MIQYLEMIFKIGLTIVLSGFIGYERELKHKGAGFRTHILVGVGSTLIILTTLIVYETYKQDAAIDPTRIIAAIVQGIGFLCAGTIIRAGSQVRGLTTAATLWIVSCLGISIGFGHYFAAIFVALVVFMVLVVSPFLNDEK